MMRKFFIALFLACVVIVQFIDLDTALYYAIVWTGFFFAGLAFLVRERD